jgi:hypothetical protein
VPLLFCSRLVAGGVFWWRYVRLADKWLLTGFMACQASISRRFGPLCQWQRCWNLLDLLPVALRAANSTASALSTDRGPSEAAHSRSTSIKACANAISAASRGIRSSSGRKSRECHYMRRPSICVEEWASKYLGSDDGNAPGPLLLSRNRREEAPYFRKSPCVIGVLDVLHWRVNLRGDTHGQ